MSPSDLTVDPAPSKAPAAEARVEFPDNRVLIDVCGEFDRNLATIETALGVQIIRRGNAIVVMGEDGSRDRTLEILNALYDRRAAGRDVEAGDVDRELRMGGPDADTGKRRIAKGDQLEMSVGSNFEIKTRKKLVEPRTDAQKAYVQSLFENELAFGIGPAGTGKTYLAVAVGVSMFISGHVDKIILSRPAVEAGERLGFLPGALEDKVDPYMQPLYDALNDFLPAKQLAKLREEKVIEIAPLAFMRGRTLSNAYVVLDEAQNATTMQMKMFLTRLGYNSTAVITGDITQIDLPKTQKSGLKDAIDVLDGVEGIGFTFFEAKDVVRHSLVQKVIVAYEKAGKNS